MSSKRRSSWRDERPRIDFERPTPGWDVVDRLRDEGEDHYYLAAKR